MSASATQGGHNKLADDRARSSQPNCGIEASWSEDEADSLTGRDDKLCDF